MWKRRILSYLGLGAAATLITIFSVPSFRAGETSVAGRTAPAFSFTLDGKPANLDAFRGKIVVLNFWATWCPPCVAETASLEHMYAQLEPLGVTVLGVSVDDDDAAYRKFLTDHHITFPTYRDADSKIPLSYGTAMYPETYIIGRNGKIERKLIGEQAWDSPHMLAYFRAIAQGRTPTTF
jgi:cytochrome c biogenesis protein CcmG, thiol:disulfide interchange protein DsbE